MRQPGGQPAHRGELLGAHHLPAGGNELLVGRLQRGHVVAQGVAVGADARQHALQRTGQLAQLGAALQGEEGQTALVGVGVGAADELGHRPDDGPVQVQDAQRQQGEQVDHQVEEGVAVQGAGLGVQELIEGKTQADGPGGPVRQADGHDHIQGAVGRHQPDPGEPAQHPRGCAGGERAGQERLQGGLFRRVGAAAGGCSTLAQRCTAGHGPGAEHGRAHQGGQERLFRFRAEPLAGRSVDDQPDLLFFFAGHEQRRLAQPEQRGDGKCQRRGQAEEDAQGAGDVGVQAETHSPSPARW